jgi:hypothetical protein
VPSAKSSKSSYQEHQRHLCCYHKDRREQTCILHLCYLKQHEAFPVDPKGWTGILGRLWLPSANQCCVSTTVLYLYTVQYSLYGPSVRLVWVQFFCLVALFINTQCNQHTRTNLVCLPSFLYSTVPSTS